MFHMRGILAITLAMGAGGDSRAGRGSVPGGIHLPLPGGPSQSEVRIEAFDLAGAKERTLLQENPGDIARCKAQGMDYQAAGYPGTAFFNSNGSPKNLIPKKHGDFMWSQFAGMRNAGVKSVYIAMFDELNEATSIFKVAEDASMVPTGGYYLTLGADGVHVSSDFYLRLVDNGARMVKGLIPYQAAHTTPFMP